MTREEKIALLVDELEDIRCDNFDADTNEDKTLKEAVRVIKTLDQEPCGDAISRQAVLDLINKFVIEIHSEGGRDLNAHTNDVLRQILRNVKSDRVLPPVTPQPKTGHWIKTISENGITSAVRCSECGFEDNRYMLFKYCPNCGARMVEPQERNNKE